ncbi:hypothetical protein L7F22_053006 [Adiantum nelumboides]|nr:hypothetical protein [Adiantum nelumboides]
MAAAPHAGGKPPANNVRNRNSNVKSSSSGRPPPPPLPTKGRSNRHGQQQRYYGRMASNVTDYLKKAVPSHAFHPTLLHRPTPSYHRKASSISDYIERQVRPPPQPRRPFTAPDVYFGRRASNVTDHLRYIPPAHLGLHAHAKSLPYFGRLATSVTDPSKYEAGDDVDPITSHWSRSRPSSARLPIPPQHVSKDILFSALSARGPHPAASSRRPTHIGYLLKHQFAHLLATDVSPASSPRSPRKHVIKPAGKRPDTAPAATFISSKPGSTPSTERQCVRHASSPAVEQQQQLTIAKFSRIKDHMSPASPRSLSARSSLSGADHSRGAALSKLNKHVSNTQVEQSPRRRIASKSRTNAEDMSTSINRSMAAEETRSGSSNMQGEEVLVEVGEGGSRSGAMQNGEEMDMEEEGQSINGAAAGQEAGRGQSMMCDDGSSETTEEMGPEKLEFVSKWVQQERSPENWSSPQQRLKAWPNKPIDKAVDHSRRATSVTKYNIWT